jgi:hypothetical protein
MARFDEADNSHNVPAPGSVRVWRGYRSASLSLEQFWSILGTVFVPATVLMQKKAGLYSYAPTVLAGLSDKPDSVPDETAILFWESPETYWDAFATLAVRTYTLTHAGVYLTANDQSRADLPIHFSGTLLTDQPVYVIDRPADWMRGAITHLAAARNPETSVVNFRHAIERGLSAIKELPEIQGAIACIRDDHLLYWELRARLSGKPSPPSSGVPLLQGSHLGWNQVFAAAPTFLPIGLWDLWSGMDIRAGSSLNLQFDRGDRT